MPEGDTVFLTADRLRKALEGRVVSKTDFRVPRWATVDLSGRRVQSIVARGKHLLIRFEGGPTLHTHFKMEGEWHLYRHGERWRGPAHQVRAVLETQDLVAVGFRLATVELIDTQRENEVLGRLGPDLLGPDWDSEEAARRVGAEPARAIGDVLLDQTVMAGIGNIYRSEICFLRGVHPGSLVSEAGNLLELVTLARRLLLANATTGRQVTTGEDRPGRTHWVYGRRGRPCRRCGTAIAKDRDEGARVVYWCLSCQPARQLVEKKSR